MTHKKIKFFLIVSLVLTPLITACDTINSTDLFKKKSIPDCPAVRLLKDAEKITAYNLENGQDITNINYEAKFTGFSGECEYIKSKGEYTSVILNLTLGMKVALGPALKSRQLQLRYFIAIPDFYPHPHAKKMFTKLIEFPANLDQMIMTDKDLTIKIPLNNRLKGPNVGIVIGFDLTKDQLYYNRGAQLQRLLENR